MRDHEIPNFPQRIIVLLQNDPSKGGMLGKWVISSGFRRGKSSKKVHLFSRGYEVEDIDYMPSWLLGPDDVEARLLPFVDLCAR